MKICLPFPPNVVGFEERVRSSKVIQANPKKVSGKSKWKDESSTSQLNRKSVLRSKSKAKNKEAVSGKSKVRFNSEDNESSDDVSFNQGNNVRTVVSEIDQSTSGTYNSRSKVLEKRSYEQFRMIVMDPNPVSSVIKF